MACGRFLVVGAAGRVFRFLVCGFASCIDCVGQWDTVPGMDCGFLGATYLNNSLQGKPGRGQEFVACVVAINTYHNAVTQHITKVLLNGISAGLTCVRSLAKSQVGEVAACI